ncbi:MAG TPA: phytanoyl-CoA dioxygenase family protein [Pyrinomonadaceae bacterium]|nr:phytanoyl-CoA dioxygenase family protein [Pyrinomonadaceae bacterium]
MREAAIKAAWEENGFVVIPRLFDAPRIRELQVICDDVLAQWIEESPASHDAANSTNMAFLTEPRYFIKHPERLRLMLETITDEKIFKALAEIIDGEPLFHNTQYFFNPATATRAGDWHRDQQFDAPDEETERARMLTHTGVHVHIAFLPDDNLEFVPGTHARWDTPVELEIRRGFDGRSKNSDAMPGARRLALRPGDAAFFSAWGIHRGRYDARTPRRTFDIIYASENPCDWYTPPPTCFLQPGLLDRFDERSRRFFQRFIEAYRHRWARGEGLNP